MIDRLTIKNIALIEEIEICFNENLNILSGETGAGKSIIIDSVGFLLGQKIDSEFIRTGEDFAEITGVFYINNDRTINLINDLGINLDEDNLLIINRIANRNGKTITRVNGKISTVGMLKEIGRLLIDIHGQHEHQSLLIDSNHIGILDRFCEVELHSFKEYLSGIYSKYKNITMAIEKLISDQKDKFNKIDLLTFQINEIESADLSEDEEEKLLEQKKILSSSEKLQKNTQEAISLLYDFEGELSAIDKIEKALDNLNEISLLDISQRKNYERLYSAKVEIEDIVTEIRTYSDSLEYNPMDIDSIESRLNIIYNLKRKYGSNIKEILNYYHKIKKDLEIITNSEEELELLEKEKNSLYNEGVLISEKISKVRKKEALSLENKIESVLKELGMKEVEFSISITEMDNFNQNGFDKVEFLISPNLGEPLKSLSKIASGGEMSRIMLALKTVLAKADNIETFIFDEIDTGVSGRTAQKVAEKLKIISKEHQILCITHLPQIAAMASKHFLIEKQSVNEKTFTTVIDLSEDKSVKEIARLIGGAVITEQTHKTASEMISQAKKI